MFLSKIDGNVQRKQKCSSRNSKLHGFGGTLEHEDIIEGDIETDENDFDKIIPVTTFANCEYDVILIISSL